jgi:hypothetical protein
MMLLHLFRWVWGSIPAPPAISSLWLLTLAAIRSGTPGSLSLVIRGQSFLECKGPKGKPLLPSTHKDGPWMSVLGTELTSFTHLCCSITCHALIGEYHAKFNIDGLIHCDCDVYLSQTRDHLVHVCRNITRPHQHQGVSYLTSFVGLLGTNPGLFAFTTNDLLVWDPG